MPPASTVASFGMRRVEPVHVMRRVARPALAAHVLVEPAVAVGDDVEAGHFLFAQIDRQRIDVLLAEPADHHRVEERLQPRFSVYQLGRGNDPVIVVGRSARQLLSS